MAFEFEAAVGGATVLNSVGAAASIPRAHLHVVSDQQPFLSNQPEEPVELDLLADLDVAASRLAEPFPVLVLALRGSIAARAQALALLTEHRSALAYNIVSQGGTSWFVPRSAQEITAPHFPQALGGAEFWGRWCFGDEEPFRAMTTADAEAALRMAGVPSSSPLQT